MKHTFRRGVHPPHNKGATDRSAVGAIPPPSVVYISLSQHVGAPAVPVVEAGAHVAMGQTIAECSGKIGARIFASVSGTVRGIEDRVTIGGRKEPHIVIENDGADTAVTLPPLVDPTPEAIRERAAACGIVGLGGAGFPLAVKLAPRNSVDTLVINAAECEPYITCDHRILLEYERPFAKGAELLRRALGATSVVVGLEDNKRDCIPSVEDALRADCPSAKLVVLPTKYPQGAEKQLIYATTGRKVPCGGLPADVGCNVNNVHTAFALYRAVCEGKPLFERIVTVTGDACARPGNFWVRNGTPVSHILDFCGVTVSRADADAAEKAAEEAQAALDAALANGADKATVNALRKEAAARKKASARALKNSLGKMISGGPMMGMAFSNADATVVKATSCILLLPRAEEEKPDPSPCINCGRCARACPMMLMPMYIDAYTLVSDWKNAKKYGATDCIQCGCCSYVCPAKRTLTQSIQFAKKMIREKGV